MFGKFKFKRSMLVPGIMFLTLAGAACSVSVNAVNEGGVQETAPAPSLATQDIAEDGSENSSSQQVIEEVVNSEASTNNEQVSEGSTVEPDPDFRKSFAIAGLRDTGWNTDFSLHTVPFDEITFVVPRDGIPALDNPVFVIKGYDECRKDFKLPTSVLPYDALACELLPPCMGLPIIHYQVGVPQIAGYPEVQDIAVKSPIENNCRIAQRAEGCRHRHSTHNVVDNLMPRQNLQWIGFSIPV